jgi:hypothetical protein
MELKKKPELKEMFEWIGNRPPPDMHPLLIIKEYGCENEFFILTDEAKREMCKYKYCPHFGVCLEVS